jgi:hypothetical protein
VGTRLLTTCLWKTSLLCLKRQCTIWREVITISIFV